MKIKITILAAVFLLTACTSSQPTAQIAVTQKPIVQSTATRIVIPTFTPQPTRTQIPSPTFEPTAIPTIALVPQQWNGTYTYPNGTGNFSGKIQNISLLIEKIKGMTFTGKMVWQAFSTKARGAVLKMSGEYVTDFGDAAEQAKWNNLEDYKNGDKTGAWLKWTETEIITGRFYTVNGWYYAHIREDGTMVAIYYFSKTETVAGAGTFVLRQVKQ